MKIQQMETKNLSLTNITHFLFVPFVPIHEHSVKWPPSRKKYNKLSKTLILIAWIPNDLVNSGLDFYF